MQARFTERSRARRHAIIAAAITLAALPVSGYSLGVATPPDSPCALLTTAEITKAVGAPTKQQETRLPNPNGPSKADSTRMCTWVTPGGAVNVAFAKAGESAAARKSFRDRMQQPIRVLKAQGWTFDEKAYGSDQACWIGTPRAGDKEAPRMTGCVGETSGFGISVGVTGGSRVEMDTMKALLDAAIGRFK